MSKSIPGTSSRADQVLKRMRAVGIFEKDLTEEFVTSSGPGGQNVNKVATCVVLVHRPSGERVKCHYYRTQLANRVYARELLLERLESAARLRLEKAGQAKAKERARRRGRSARGKEKTLERKHQRSAQKQSRKKVPLRDI